MAGRTNANNKLLLLHKIHMITIKPFYCVIGITGSLSVFT